MKITDVNTTIVDSYVGLLNNLSSADKLDIISRLTALVKTDLSKKSNKFKSAFGAFNSQKTAEEIIIDIRDSRTSTRKMESF